VQPAPAASHLDSPAALKAVTRKTCPVSGSVVPSVKTVELARRSPPNRGAEGRVALNSTTIGRSIARAEKRFVAPACPFQAWRKAPACVHDHRSDKDRPTGAMTSSCVTAPASGTEHRPQPSTELQPPAPQTSRRSVAAALQDTCQRVPVPLNATRSVNPSAGTVSVALLDPVVVGSNRTFTGQYEPGFKVPHVGVSGLI